MDTSGSTVLVTAPTDGDTSARAMVADVINASWEQGNRSKDQLSAKIADASNGFLSTLNAPNVSVGSVDVPLIVAPNVQIPATQAGDVMSTWNSRYQELVTALAGYFSSFISTYFPDNTAMYSQAENLLQGMMSSNNYLPPAVQAALLGDAHARVIADKTRAQQAAIGGFAAKGFPLPPAVAAAIGAQIEQKAQTEIAGSIRQIIVSSIEQMRFVVQSALSARQNALNAATEYVKALASAPDIASKTVSVGYDAQSKLIAAAADFYRADTSAKDVMSKVSQYNNSTQLDANVKNQAAELELIKSKAQALLSECDMMSRIVTSLFNNIHASVGVSASRGTSVGYSYSNDTASKASTVTDVG